MEEVEAVVFLNSVDAERLLSVRDIGTKKGSSAGKNVNASSKEGGLTEFVLVAAGETGTVRFYSVSMKVMYDEDIYG